MVYNQQMNKITDYTINNIDKSDKQLLLNAKFKVLLRISLQWADRINNDDEIAIKLAKKIIEEIDKTR